MVKFSWYIQCVFYLKKNHNKRMNHKVGWGLMVMFPYWCCLNVVRFVMVLPLASFVLFHYWKYFLDEKNKIKVSLDI